MKKLLLALALIFVPAGAWAQCAGVFPAHTVCGNTGASPNVPTAVPFGGTIIGPGTTVIGDFATWGDVSGNTLADTPYAGLTHGGLGGDQSAATAGQVPIFPGSGGAAVPGGLSSIVGTATAAQIAGSAASHAVPIDVAGTPTWKVIPNCVDSAGQHINYTQSTDAWSCGTSNGINPSGFYTVQYLNSAWTCTKPDGTTVNVSASTTSGVQECINAMHSANAGNFRAICPNPASNIQITATTTITIGPDDSSNYNFEGCYLHSTASPAITVNAMNFSASLDWASGIIYCSGSPCIDINPTSASPLFGNYGITGGHLNFPFIITIGCAADGDQSAGVHINPNGGVAGSHVSAIYGEKISIGFIDGFDGSHNCFYNGFASDNPTNTFAAFGQNYIYIGYIQGFAHWAVANGTGAVTQATQALATNEWDIGSIGSGGTTDGGFLQYGFLDRIFMNVSINSGTMGVGLEFQNATANGNYFIVPQLDGTTPLTDNGTTVLNKGFYNGTLH